MSVYSVSSKDELDKMVSESDTPIFVKFFATWCGPCGVAAPVVKELSSEYEGKVKFVQIDIDSHSCRDIINDYGVSSVPTFIILEKGKELNRLVGFIDKTNLEDFIKSTISV